MIIVLDGTPQHSNIQSKQFVDRELEELREELEKLHGSRGRERAGIVTLNYGLCILIRSRFKIVFSLVVILQKLYGNQNYEYSLSTLRLLSSCILTLLLHLGRGLEEASGCQSWPESTLRAVGRNSLCNPQQDIKVLPLEQNEDGAFAHYDMYVKNISSALLMTTLLLLHSIIMLLLRFGLTASAIRSI
jgi:hypothetical protein